MKKLMIAAAAVMAGVAVQAASFGWSVGTIYEAPAEGGWGDVALTGSPENYAAQLFVYSDAGMENLVDIGAAAGDWGSWEDGWSGGMEDSKNPLPAPAEGFTTYYGKVVLTYNGEAGVQTMTSEGFQFNVTGANPDPYIVIATDDESCSGFIEKIGGGDFNSGTGAFKSGWTSAVPEPTSGLLLLLGVAGLALRRRRA